MLLLSATALHSSRTPWQIRSSRLRGPTGYKTMLTVIDCFWAALHLTLLFWLWKEQPPPKSGPVWFWPCIHSTSRAVCRQLAPHKQRRQQHVYPCQRAHRASTWLLIPLGASVHRTPGTLLIPNASALQWAPFDIFIPTHAKRKYVTLSQILFFHNTIIMTET